MSYIVYTRMWYVVSMYMYRNAFLPYVWHFDCHSPKEPLHGTKDERDGNKRFVTRKAFAGAV
jgi:hypothetical protein